jgi:hypothetical protein
MHARSHRLATAVVFALLGLLAACGDSEDTTSTGDTTGGNGATTTAGDGGGGGSGDASGCPEGRGTLTISAIGAEEAGAIADASDWQYEGRIGIEETEVEVADAVAVSIADGAALTFYLTDYELDRDTVSTATQDAAEGQLLVILAATMFQSADNPITDPPPIEAGDVIPPSGGAEDIGSGERVYTVIVDNGEEQHNESVEPEGEMEILYLDDERVCFSVDYTSYVFGTEATSRDVAKHISGTFNADLVESIF